MSFDAAKFLSGLYSPAIIEPLLTTTSAVVPAVQALDEIAAEREAIQWVENGPADEVDAALRLAVAEWGQIRCG